MKPTPQELKELLDYDPKTGLFRWHHLKAHQPRGWFKGNKSVRQYRRLWINNQHLLAHVVAWVLMTGEWPTQTVDHRDRDQSNNRWTNLRHASMNDQMHNMSRPKNNTTGFKGVSIFRYESGRIVYRATIVANGKKHHLGLFHDPIDAADAYRIAAEKHFGEYACCG